MPVGAGSIKRAAKKAAAAPAEVKEAVIAAPAEEVKEAVAAPEAPAAAPEKKPAAKKAAAKKPAAKKAAPKKAAEPAKAEEPKAEAPAAPVKEDGVRAELNGKLIANESAQLGSNERTEVTQEMPVYLL